MPLAFSSFRYASNPIRPSATTTLIEGSAASSASRCGRQRAADGGGDVRARQLQPIVDTLGGRDVGEAGAVQRTHEEVARGPHAVAGEDAPRPIGAMSSGREPDDEQPRGRIAETG